MSAKKSKAAKKKTKVAKKKKGGEITPKPPKKK